MATRTISLDELRGRSLEDVLRDVFRRREVLTVRLPEGEAVALRPSLSLKPLPTLEGSVPKVWKDAL